MQRERKDQDKIQPPPYIKDGPKEVVEESLKEHENKISTLYDEERGVIREDSNLDFQVSLDDEEIEEYYKKFTYFMQVELHKKYNLISRKRSRLPDNVEEKKYRIV